MEDNTRKEAYIQFKVFNLATTFRGVIQVGSPGSITTRLERTVGRSWRYCKGYLQPLSRNVRHSKFRVVDNKNVEMSEDKSIDLVGVGRAIEAIPPESWNRLVGTACSIVESAVAPITQTTGGLGRLIAAKFDRLIEVEKVLAAEAVASAQRKAQASGLNNTQPRPQILLQVIEQSATEADSGIRELWSNLLANEMVGSVVHPEIGRILARLSSEDAQLLVQIAETKPNRYTELFKQAMLASLKTAGLLTLASTDPKTFNHAHLSNLGLIALEEDGRWRLTVFGEGFIRAITDPSVKIAEDT